MYFLNTQVEYGLERACGVTL